MNEKADLEKAACQYFLDAYNQLHQATFQVLEHRDKPDFLAQDTGSGEVMGIEVTHLYYDAKEAQMLLGRSPGGAHGLMNIGELITTLNQLLSQKVTQAAKYNFIQKLNLLVRVVSPIFDKKDFEIYEVDITFPPGNVFNEVWLLFWNQTTQTYSDLKQIQ